VPQTGAAKEAASRDEEPVVRHFSGGSLGLYHEAFKPLSIDVDPRTSREVPVLDLDLPPKSM
jgi:hypothetical protein